MASFPQSRLRRLRESGALRLMVQETSLSVRDLVYPLFIAHGRDVSRPVEAMPDVYQLSVDRLLDEVTEIAQLGIPAVLLFGIPMRKDPQGTEAYDSQGIVQEAIRVIKQATPGLLVITDVCLCEYTDHGHCGLIVDDRVDNDSTLEILARVALSHAEAGADLVAPSAMMDGQVAAIRRALDEGGHSADAHHGILRQVRLVLLWPLQGGGRVRAPVRGPPRVSDGFGKRAAGDT